MDRLGWPEGKHVFIILWTEPLMNVVLHQALQEQLTSSVQEVGHLIEPISTAAKGEAAQLGHKVTSGFFTNFIFIALIKVLNSYY